MNNTLTKFDLSAFLRSTRPEPSRAGATLSIMLLWSQIPASKLKSLPSFRDASAEFMLNDPARVVESLCPDIANETMRLWAGQNVGELESLRRAVMNALDSGIPIDEIAEAILEYCAPDARASKERSETLLAALDAKKSTRIRCAFSFVIRPAWALSKNSIVDLDIENHVLAPIVSILAIASGRSLNARLSDINSVAGETGQQGEFDHALILPPIGMRRFSFSDNRFIDHQTNIEAYAALWGAHLGRKRNVVVGGDGLLYRTTSKDSPFKQELIHKHGLEAVVSLPRGTLPGSVASMSALVFSGEERLQSRKPAIRFMDASNPGTLDAATIRKLLAGKADHPCVADPSIQEVSEAGFNLSVARYVLDPETWHNREFLRNQETVRLSDLADIRRPQALPRDSGKEEVFEVREALLADIENGRLSLPAKLSELPRTAAAKIESAILKPGDILLSIKGTLGKTALARFIHPYTTGASPGRRWFARHESGGGAGWRSAFLPMIVLGWRLIGIGSAGHIAPAVTAPMA